MFPAGLLALPLILASGGPDAADSAAVSAAREFREAHGAEILADFAELLRIPNVQADQAGLRKTASWIRDALIARGVESRLLEVEGAPPIVWGRLDAPAARRTVGVYVHYDGQPVDATPVDDPAVRAVALHPVARKWWNAPSAARSRGIDRSRVAHLRPLGR